MEHVDGTQSDPRSATSKMKDCGDKGDGQEEMDHPAYRVEYE